ncbi:MAG: cell division protein FtsZ [Bacteroidia bacterium]|nr:cell division protein FtsZ [Bacteroidia bacterium]
MNFFRVELPKEQSSIIKVIGVGGGGSNAVNYMYQRGIVGVDFYICNTDSQHLAISPVPNKIQIGNALTEGLGAGSDPEVGRQCAIESIDRIEEALRHNTKMVFVTAGMGGGTGTGAAPVIAKKAKDMGILTVGIVTTPFKNEGPARSEQAEKGISDLRPHVDALLIISNDRILQMFHNLRFSEAFAKADDVLCMAAKGIAEIITVSGHMNVDFRDVRTAMADSGKAIMGTGTGEGEDRAIKASQRALDSPLLDETSIEGSRHILVNISYGNEEPYANEIDIITSFFQQEAGQNARLKFGLTHNASLDKELMVTVIATGFEDYAGKHILEEETGSFEIELDKIEEIIPATVAEEKPFRKDPEMPRTQDEIPFRRNPMTGNNNDGTGAMDVPAYRRKNIQLEESGTDTEVSKVFLEEEKDNKTARFKDGGNKYLHGNVD